MTEAFEPVHGHRVGLVSHLSPRSDASPTLLIFLPGFNIRAEDFIAQGFVAMLHDGEDAVDLAIAEPDLDCYLDGTLTRYLRALIADRDRQPYQRVWVGGISLGGFGALLAASGSPETIDGVVLLSPFLGAPGLIAEVRRAGGLATWLPGAIADNDGERRVLAWLKSYLQAGRKQPILQLGYGQSDRFAAAATLLAAALPPQHVHVIEGEHDWPTWTKLWRHILDARPFSAP
jgi:pimeloyl-ACP methyl ester carboxylesterase